MNIEEEIEILKKEIDEYTEGQKYSYIPERLKIIRVELKKTNSVFEVQHFSKVLSISKQALLKMESGKVGTDYNVIIKIITLFTTRGYNPLWIISKNNFFTPKKTVENDIIFDVKTVQNATLELISTLQNLDKEKQDALKDFKKQLLG